MRRRNLLTTIGASMAGLSTVGTASACQAGVLGGGWFGFEKSVNQNGVECSVRTEVHVDTKMKNFNTDYIVDEWYTGFSTDQGSIKYILDRTLKAEYFEANPLSPWPESDKLKSREVDQIEPVNDVVLSWEALNESSYVQQNDSGCPVDFTFKDKVKFMWFEDEDDYNPTFRRWVKNREDYPGSKRIDGPTLR